MKKKILPKSTAPVIAKHGLEIDKLYLDNLSFLLRNLQKSLQTLMIAKFTPCINKTSIRIQFHQFPPAFYIHTYRNINERRNYKLNLKCWIICGWDFNSPTMNKACQ